MFAVERGRNVLTQLRWNYGHPPLPVVALGAVHDMHEFAHEIEPARRARPSARRGRSPSTNATRCASGRGCRRCSRSRSSRLSCSAERRILRAEPHPKEAESRGAPSAEEIAQRLAQLARELADAILSVEKLGELALNQNRRNNTRHHVVWASRARGKEFS